MNKTKTFIVAAMLAVASLAQAKDYHLVIKGKGEIKTPRTEIFIGGNFLRDTITVTPADDITEIHITIKNLDGEEIQSETIPFNLPENFHFITPHMPEGFLLEIMDNNGVVYTGIEDED